MNRRSLVPLLVLLPALSTLLTATDAHAQRRTAAQIQNFIPNARAFGMGGAFTAVARDEWAVWWNPAALGSARSLAASFVPYSDLLPGLDEGSSLLSGAAAGARNGIGGGAYFGYMDETFPGSDLDSIWPWDVNPYEMAMHLAVGADLTRVMGHEDVPLAVNVGASVKRLTTHFAPYWAGGEELVSGSAYDADLAASIVAHLPLRAHEAAENRLTASYAHVRRNVFDRRIEYEDGQGRSDALGSLGRTGVAALAELWRNPRGPNAELTLAFDREASPRGIHEGSMHHYGVEAGLFTTFYARYGVITHPYEDSRRETWGVGLAADRVLPARLRAWRVRLDYARGPQVDSIDDAEQVTLSMGTMH